MCGVFPTALDIWTDWNVWQDAQREWGQKTSSPQDRWQLLEQIIRPRGICHIGDFCRMPRRRGRGEVQMGGSVKMPYFRRSFLFPFSLRLLAHQPQLVAKDNNINNIYWYRVYPFKTPSPSAPTIIRTKWPKTTTTTIKTTTVTKATLTTTRIRFLLVHAYLRS